MTGTTALSRRLARLEHRSILPVDLALNESVRLLRERRRRRLEASGLPVEEEGHHEGTAIPGRSLSLAETLRLRRQRRSAS